MYIGKTIKSKDGRILVVREIISKRSCVVSYGFDTKGKDVVGVIRL